MIGTTIVEAEIKVKGTESCVTAYPSVSQRTGVEDGGAICEWSGIETVDTKSVRIILNISEVSHWRTGPKKIYKRI